MLKLVAHMLLVWQKACHSHSYRFAQFVVLPLISLLVLILCCLAGEERKREKERGYIYIIHIEREKERNRETDSTPESSRVSFPHRLTPNGYGTCRCTSCPNGVPPLLSGGQWASRPHGVGHTVAHRISIDIRLLPDSIRSRSRHQKSSLHKL
jgi:hypothetical protein